MELGTLLNTTSQYVNNIINKNSFHHAFHLFKLPYKMKSSGVVAVNVALSGQQTLVELHAK